VQPLFSDVIEGLWLGAGKFKGVSMNLIRLSASSEEAGLY
jgi:hypothetical protein